jgi:hypothetical protein
MKKNDNKRTRFWTILLGFLFPFVFTAISFLLNPEPYLGWLVNTNQFTKTSGKITSSTIEVGGSASKNAIGWNFIIEYEYEVLGKVYKSSRVLYGYTGSSNRDYAESYVKKYPEGETVLVYYHPDRPEESVLEPFVREYEVIYAFFGSLFFGLFIAWIGFNVR